MPFFVDPTSGNFEGFLRGRMPRDSEHVMIIDNYGGDC